ncbi:hypothetical protein ACFP2F_22575 [Hymenobacter artigasi]|uniref:Uncharacterized protein n=1 Tax=Hymenobacter artigasi TaxID=2719616 RepID=A0ABX1HPD1_9BACT|nr:hypothetical protein [Hymenobacter artigasi]NKI92010.1 hypothetical protein [Hymenobacter artigasi]
MRSHLLALSGNGMFFLWAWLGFHHGKGLFFFTTDVLGLMFLLPLVVVGNAGLCVAALLANNGRWAKAFGMLVVLSMSGCIAAWVHGAATGAAF